MALKKMVNGVLVSMTTQEEAAFLADQAAGTVPQVPQEVTMRQGRLALLAAGFLDNVESAIAAMPEPQQSAARIVWDYSSVIQRNQPLVLQLGPVLGLDSDDLDQLFIHAATL